MFEPAARAAATTDLEGVVAILVLDDEAGFVGVECEEDEEGILDGVFVVEGVLDLEGVAGCERGVEGWFLTEVVGKEEKEEVEEEEEEEGDGFDGSKRSFRAELGVREVDNRALPPGDLLGVLGDSRSSRTLIQEINERERVKKGLGEGEREGRGESVEGRGERGQK